LLLCVIHILNKINLIINLYKYEKNKEYHLNIGFSIFHSPSYNSKKDLPNQAHRCQVCSISLGF